MPEGSNGGETSTRSAPAIFTPASSRTTQSAFYKLETEQRESGARNNEIEISGSVVGSWVSINQNQNDTRSLRDENIDYEIEESSYRVVSTDSARRLKVYSILCALYLR